MNWKDRIKNKTFVAGVISAGITFTYQVLGLCGIVPPISQNEAVQATGIILNLIYGVAVVVDPTTQGITD